MDSSVDNGRPRAALAESADAAVAPEPGESASSRLGLAAGWAIAPLFAFVSRLRHARTFHPSGPTFHAVVTRHPSTSGPAQGLADRLAGQALVRFSGALWKHAERIPDVLGCAIRLRRDGSATAEPGVDDQDLLFATIRRPWTMPLSPFTTNVRDYLGNDYFAVSPFDVGLGRLVYLRLHPSHVSAEPAGVRAERLARDVARGHAELDLELGEHPFGPFAPLLKVILERLAEVDGEALRFRPFRRGRAIHPRGFVHALRVGVYTWSQRARPLGTATSPP